MRSLGVFVGPSLPHADRIPAAGVRYLPPAARGDLSRASTQFDAVLLLDGVFHDALAVSPKETFEALQRTVVFGAASMGALRAAECKPYGARPLGAIANWYVRERIDGDDEVALLFDPDSERALTIPLVNVRYLVWIALRRNVLREPEASELVRCARAIYYAERDWPAVLDLAPPRTRGALALLTAGADLKRLDARFALRRCLP